MGKPLDLSATHLNGKGTSDEANPGTARLFRIGQTYRYARPYASEPPVIDGLPNYFSLVHTEGKKLALLEAGINPMRSVPDVAGNDACPAILLSSSPHKVGSSSTPWQDVFDIDNGSIRYFGDNKDAQDPSLAKGNVAILKQQILHSAQDAALRVLAAPFLFFRRVVVDGRRKGNVNFQGVGILRKTQRVTEFDRANDAYFTNYAFEYVVLDLSAEAECLDWRWIEARATPRFSPQEALKFAPQAWREWVRHGDVAVERCRRRVSKLRIVRREEQIPKPGTPDDIALRQIYEHYSEAGRRKYFEHLASLVVQRIATDSGSQYLPGWVTRTVADGGADFIGRLDVGSGFSRAKLVVLGQAKCEKLDAPTGGNHIARTVARLKRGWIGAYVTTSYFSEAVQMEVAEDEYPILLVNGLIVARTVLAMSRDAGQVNLKAFLDNVDARYSESVHDRRPEEILRD